MSSGNNFLDTRFILPTSNICERLFSKAGFALSDRRKSIHPAALEEQMFLHINSSLWNIDDVKSGVSDAASTSE